MTDTCDYYKVFYTNMMNNIPCIYFELDQDGIIQKCSCSASELFGKDETEFVGTPLSQYFTDEIDEEFFADCLAGAKDIMNHEFTVSGKSGSEIVLRAKSLTSVTGGGFSFLSVDVTSESEAEEKELLIKEKFERILSEKSREMSLAYNELENFCAIIAHEFKAPIRAIGLYNNIIYDELSGDISGDSITASYKIKEYCDKSLDMIEKLLDYSKVKSHKLRNRTVDMNQLVRSCLHDLKLIYGRIDIRVSISPLPCISGDEFLMKRAVFNILENSVKYSALKPYTEIDISCVSDEKTHTFCFRDHGAGFDVSSSADPFGMFSRLHSDEVYKGSGIGLATVMNIVKKHGGEVSISPEPDEGCLVRMKLGKHLSEAYYC